LGKPQRKKCAKPQKKRQSIATTKTEREMILRGRIVKTKTEVVKKKSKQKIFKQRPGTRPKGWRTKKRQAY